MTDKRTKLGVLAEWAFVVLLAFPVVGVLMGGVYALPAMRLTRRKEPYLTLLLCACLALPVVLIGSLLHVHPGWMKAHWLLGIVLLLARRRLGPLDGNVERFGMVNAFTVLVAVGGGMLVCAGVLAAAPF